MGMATECGCQKRCGASTERPSAPTVLGGSLLIVEDRDVRYGYKNKLRTGIILADVQCLELRPRNYGLTGNAAVKSPEGDESNPSPGIPLIFGHNMYMLRSILQSIFLTVNCYYIVRLL